MTNTKGSDSMKITSISVQQNNPGRVNVAIDGSYSFSLTIPQLANYSLKVDQVLSGEKLELLKSESEFGKLYTRALDFCLIRPRSKKEVRDYLSRKAIDRRYKDRNSGELRTRPGVSQSILDRVFTELVSKGYLDDVKFTKLWIENRNIKKGTSLRKLRSELIAKGVAGSIIDDQFSQSTRDDLSELQKIIRKKYYKYEDKQKLVQYLARNGFGYDDIKDTIKEFQSNLT